LSLDLVPTLRLRGNRILRRGPDGVDKVDPARISEWAGEVADTGARWVHVEDLDARDGRANQWTSVPALQSQGLRVQYGGGVQRMVQVQQLLDLGVDQVVVGRQAQAEPRWAEELVRLYPGKIVLCLGGRGEKQDTLVQRAKNANAWHVAGLLVPGAPGVPDTELLTTVHKNAPSPRLYAESTNTSGDHIGALEDAGAQGVLLSDVASGDLRRLVESFPQRRMAAPIQVLRAREASSHEAWLDDPQPNDEPTDEDA
jgi:hypothetical protein